MVLRMLLYLKPHLFSSFSALIAISIGTLAHLGVRMLRRGGDTCHKNHKKRDLELQERGHHGLQEEQVSVLLL